MLQRRSLLLQMYKFGSKQGCMDSKASTSMPAGPIQLELNDIRKSFDHSSSSNSLNGDDDQKHGNNRKSLGGYFRATVKQILRKPSSVNGGREISKCNSSSSENRHARLPGDTTGLTLHASTMKVSSSLSSLA
ncbi:hypothetical protein V6N11_039899 [Hibiscus sabdariffa]|uniref:Uncharacterized protein n=1 Tax=Hibiscus sabdariffa TaxID=183260 RepID=A0ABR2RFU4_9ROSI